MRSTFRLLWLCCGLLLSASFVAAQAGPPYYTNDPGTPGHLNWEINVGYMPFMFSDNSVSHVPDVDINFGIGDRIQLTYENAWLRVRDPGSNAKFGLGQSNAGVKWRFCDRGENKLQVSVFPQLFVNNPNNSVRRGLVPPNNAFLFPIEISDKLGPVNVDFETGYQLVRHGDDGWLAGVVVGRDVTKRLELDAEFYNQGPFHSFGETQPVLDAGARFKFKKSLILLVMAGRGLEHSQPAQPGFVGYFGLQFLLSSEHHKSDVHRQD